jgi:hypothetical protein
VQNLFIKVWPPKQCQCCLSTEIEHVFREEHEGTTDWAYCRICNANQVYWFENVNEAPEFCTACSRPNKSKGE